MSRPTVGGPAISKTWLRALERTAQIRGTPTRTLPLVVDELAEAHGEATALFDGAESLSFRGLAIRSNQYARWALEQGIEKGDVVCLLMPNCPEYMAIWLGITKVGGVAALLNTNLIGASLAHCIRLVSPKRIVVGADLAEPLTTALAESLPTDTIWVYDAGTTRLPRIDRSLESLSGDPLAQTERRPLTIEDRALHIYTSGTTGYPKAANVSHFRLMQWTHWFAGMMDVVPGDRMYNCLPMYHSVGGVLATGAVLVGGGAVFIRERFSAQRFWQEVVQSNCTLMQYIGELCRYLLGAKPSPYDTQHRLRLCCGNGLRGDIWREFKERFQIPQILEFYASTEGAVSLFNVEGKPGAIGRTPSYIAHRSPVELVRFDFVAEVPFRDQTGRCLRCDAGEVGEAIGKIDLRRATNGNRFEGYTDSAASEQKVLRNVFEGGDAWFRTGDLMRKDGDGYYYFVDRVGDTFRWKGENVSTSEVAHAILELKEVKDAVVYGVAIPKTDGRAGMATLTVSPGFDPAALKRHLAERLPTFAHPLFLRIASEVKVTTTFKHQKHDLVRLGVDPSGSDEVIYFNHPDRNEYVQLDSALYDAIRNGQLKL